MSYRAIIADDEPLARDRIRTLLQHESDFTVVAEAADGEEAVAAVRAHRPDVLFLDIQMPGLDGFGVLRALAPGPLPLVIFCTAFDEHAVKAFEAQALDYLLKPFKQARFRDAVQRARRRLQASAGDPEALARQLAALLASLPGRGAPAEPTATPPPGPPASGPLTRLAVKNNERTLFVRIADVDWIESAGNYAVVHVGKENHILRETMGGLESSLPPGFLRISRSAIVNLDRVKELQSMTAGEHIVILRDGRKLPMTRGIREVEERLRFS